ncbi:glycosyltransferase [Candidatus Microgenomates bacterium]|nr:glycosyltransferase [Candidatus Microgenomates bacterium]
MKQFSIIIPVKNEAHNLAPLAEKIDRACRAEGLNYEIIIVVDVSTDNSLEHAKGLTKKYPIKVLVKDGKTGKGFSLWQGVAAAEAEIVGMIDGDLQYPAESLPQMFSLLSKNKELGVVVANRKKYHSSWFRRFSSRVNAFLVGRLLLGLNCDIQSGLKVFRKEIARQITKNEISPWTFDTVLLHYCQEMGFKISSLDIAYFHRIHGKSHVKFFHTAVEIVSGNLKIKFKRKKTFTIDPLKKNSMIGAGVVYKKKRFITHTTLPLHKTALKTLSLWQKFFFLLVIFSLVLGLILNAHFTALLFVAVLSFIYFLDVIFNTYVILRSLYSPPEIHITEEALAALKEKTLPIYSILCPLYKEASVLPQFLDSIQKIDWPKSKLEVLLLLEENDRETIEAANNTKLPSYFKIIVVPESQPKTKPKACNYGLHFAQGEYVVIYDAEDIPDPQQLKKAYLAFSLANPQTICLQAKLNYYNPKHNLLTRLFTAEYSLWFDVVLPGLQSIDTTIPLGGTSNHFRRKDLLKLHGWDPFNVTEDCDLGVRLFREGYKTAIIDSTTLEEANSNIKNWFRQRSRWIKGYIQTYFVHSRNNFDFLKNHRSHSLIFQIVIGGKTAFMLINPFLWLATASYFLLYSLVGPTIESLYPTAIFYMAVSSLVFGNFICLYNYMIGCAKRGHWELIKYVYLIPVYWLMVSISAFIALIQLIFKPHYWEKTIHGFHLQKAKVIRENNNLTKYVPLAPVNINPHPSPNIALGGAILVISSLASYFLNFLFNIYLGKTLSVVEFGTVSLIGGFLYLSQIPLGALSRTVIYKTAYLLGKQGSPSVEYWLSLRKKILPFSFILSLLWLISTPLLQGFFKTDSILPFVLFAPVWVFSTLYSVDTAFLSGSHIFIAVSFLLIIEAAVKLLFVLLATFSGQTQFVYASIPFSILMVLMLSRVIIRKDYLERIGKSVQDYAGSSLVPKKFYFASLLNNFSTISVLSLDVIFAKHYLSAVAAGEYALLSLSGKIIFMLGSLFSQFINPLVSKKEGEGKNSKTVFYLLLLAVFASSVFGVIFLSFFGGYFATMLFGEKGLAIVPYLGKYSLAFALFGVAMSFISYHQIKKEYYVPIVSSILTLFIPLGIIYFHQNIAQVVNVMFFTSLFFTSAVVLMHIFSDAFGILFSNFSDLLGLFKVYNVDSHIGGKDHAKARILIFNWRDTKHVWAGGAEKYLFELARRWIKKGYEVTIFCGNDKRHKSLDELEGVKIIRRGGFYTVYFWAFIYYLFRLRGKYDFIIDSQNGVPFLTPLYSSLPKFVLIFHIHQEVFRRHLRFPFSQLARFIESRLTPLVYKKQKFITISESSKKEMLKLGMGIAQEIKVINPGIEEVYPEDILPKSKTVLFSYLGRLKPYKNVDIAIKAFSRLKEKYDTAKLIIAGDGEDRDRLKNLVRELKLESSIEFLGKVNDAEKNKVLSQSWAVLQPSSIEGWGITVIEANAAGTCVIASNVSGLKDSVVEGKTGILVPPRQIEAWYDAMLKIAQDRNLRLVMSLEAQTWARNFSWEKSAEELLRHIEYELYENKRIVPSRKLSFVKKNL